MRRPTPVRAVALVVALLLGGRVLRRRQRRRRDVADDLDHRAGDRHRRGPRSATGCSSSRRPAGGVQPSAPDRRHDHRVLRRARTRRRGSRRRPGRWPGFRREPEGASVIHLVFRFRAGDAERFVQQAGEHPRPAAARCPTRTGLAFTTSAARRARRHAWPARTQHVTRYGVSVGSGNLTHRHRRVPLRRGGRAGRGPRASTRPGPSSTPSPPPRSPPQQRRAPNPAELATLRTQFRVAGTASSFSRRAGAAAVGLAADWRRLASSRRCTAALARARRRAGRSTRSALGQALRQPLAAPARGCGPASARRQPPRAPRDRTARAGAPAGADRGSASPPRRSAPRRGCRTCWRAARRARPSG